MWNWCYRIGNQLKFNRLFVNISHVFIAKVVSSAISIIIFLFLVRIFTVEDYGDFSFFTSMAALLTVLSNWGVNEFILREGAANPKRLSELVQNSMFIKGSLGLTFGVLAAGYLLVKAAAPLNILIFMLIQLVALVDAQTITFIMAFRSQGNTGFEAWFFPCRNACRLLTIVLLSLWNKGFLEIVCGMVLVNLVGLMVAGYSFQRLRHEDRSCKISLRGAFGIARSSTPFVIFAAIGMAYARLDQIMLGLIKNSSEVAIYAVAWQVYETATFLPASIYIILLPKLTKIYTTDPGRWIEHGTKALGFAILVGSVVAISLFITLPYGIRYLFGAKYLASEPVIKVLMVAYIFHFVWVAILISLQISGGNTGLLNIIVVASLALNILANLYLIPHYGPMGAAYATILCEVFTFAAGIWWFLRKISDMKLAVARTY